MYSLRSARSSERDVVAQLIYDSTNHWYESHGFGKIFQGKPEDCRVFFDVYEQLDPGCCLVAEDDETGEIIGSCFYRERPTHFSLGIMNSSPKAAGRKVARTLLQKIASLSKSAGKPLRLFSSAMNLDSYSLYNRQGFVPYVVYQDVIFTVPEDGLPAENVLSASADNSEIRSASLEDLTAIVELERQVWGVSREKDWRYFLEDSSGIWDVLVAAQGEQLTGVMASVRSSGCQMVGPGVSTDSEVAAKLISRALDRFRGSSVVILIPSKDQSLIQAMYQLGGKNCELHFGQSLGDAPTINGVVVPSFLPESG
ncbi:GNAT family N-acetyltransferase [Thalassoglobus sp. JC818]|uniref:GNAT family N-acetyltransferase n=1 Tax=Thalassoglobus sp. JC818 TaxID=3232136 RepID=UPI00345A7A05